MPEDRFLSFKGLTVRFRVSAPEGEIRRRALLIPAPGFDAEIFDRVLPELLDAGCLCVSCDLPGFGKSMASGDVPHGPDVRAQILWGILDDVDERVGGRLLCWHLLAHGSAAVTAAAMTRMHPDSVSSLTFFCPALRAPLPGPLTRRVALGWGTKIALRWFRHAVGDRARFSRLLAFVYGRRVSDGEAARLRGALVRSGGEDNFLRLLREGYQTDADLSAAAFTPKMALWGGRDALLGGGVPRKTRAMLPGAEFHVIARAGHVPMETHAREVRDYLRGWIKAMW